MDDFAELALEGANAGVDHYEKVYDPLKARIKNMHNPLRQFTSNRDSDRSAYRDDDDDPDYPDRRGSRQDRGREADPRRAYVKETYYRESGRAKSAGRYGYNDGRELTRSGQGSSRRDRDDSDSESSVSPPPRRRRDTDRLYDRDQSDYRYNPDDSLRRAQTAGENYSQKRRMPAGYIAAANRTEDPTDGTVATRRDPVWSEPRGGKRSSSTGSSSSSTTLPSSSEDEREFKRMKGKEYLSAGLAAVATIHAASGLMSSLEARDKRHRELDKGEITHAEARRKRNKLRIQDAAAIGIAALGIKGAYSEWKEVQESRQKCKEEAEEKKKRHERRVKRAERREREERGSRGSGGRREYRDDGRRDRRDGYRSA